MGNIRVMSQALANQIAAGEVVERPASCVKELLENSIDAGAKSIRVELTDGGISLISIQDDGCGMDAEDASLAFSRHATSKLIHDRDLFRVKTLGFRGEALASIAAVSKVTLQTRRQADIHGVEVSVVGTDQVEGPKTIGTPPGTLIEIRDLFFNTPARLKYLRTVQTEQARCVEVVQKAALSRPDISFQCITSSHPLFQTSGRGDMREVIAALYGIGEAKQFIPFQSSTTDYMIHGFLGRPTQSRASRAHGHLFINNRPIRNIAVHQAVVSGYQSRLMVNRHPIYVLFIDLDPMLVDVNIHPHKMEARFSEERDLCRLVQETVQKSLDEVLMTPAFHFGDSQKDNRPVEQAFVYEQKGAFVNRQSTPRENREWPDQRSVRTGMNVKQEDVMTALKPLGFTQQSSAMHEDLAIESVVERRPDDWHLRPIGQALGMYVLADDGESLYVIDQHAAHERILYERFSKRMREKEILTMPLLTPIQQTLSPSDHAFLMNHLELFSQMGLHFEEFGGYDVLVRSVPDIWEGLDMPKLVGEVCQFLHDGRMGKDAVDVLREMIVTRACKAAIKANWYLSKEEMEALCTSLSKLDDPFHCPHGRPVFIRMTNRDLEKGFRRIV